MKLNNVYRLGDDKTSNISISDGRFTNDRHLAADELQLVFDQAIAFPGIINSHDHLDFNLFPQLGDHLYNNYTEWGNYIHQHFKQEIADVTKIPVELRTKWGIYKNLLCGVTTVVNHGEKLKISDSPITILDNEQSLHSVHFEKRWKTKLNYPFKKKPPVVIHTGEGTDQLAVKEIDQLISWNLLNRKLIGVHGVAMNSNQAKKFEALVWCPESNFYLLGKTAQIDELKKNTTILFGTDSTLTGSWNVWEHIRIARKTGLLTDNELLAHFTTSPAKVWQINSGQITPGFDADLVVARLKSDQPQIDSFFSLNPADILLVIHKGEIRLFDEILYSQLGDMPKELFSKMAVNGSYKYVYGDLPALMMEISRHNSAVQFPVNYN